MNILNNIRFWFQKRESDLALAAVASEQRAKYNALMGADPEKLTAAVTAFDAGTLGPLARLIEAYELRDDKMMVCSMKMKAAAARCDYTVMPREGFENDDRAKRHVELLKRFWSGISATSRFRRNERGGFSLLVKQMMEAQSYGFSVDEIVWRPLACGELAAEFIHIPLWHFENHTGELRFLDNWTAFEGTAMKPGEWLVATGDGVGIAASLVACLKRMALADWAVFCERCGMPIIHAKTGAGFGTDQWNNLRRALAAIGRDARIQTDRETDLSAISVGGGAAQPYTPLVEWADRAIAALYRGADLSTISQGGDGVGASLQGDEAGILEQDSCNRISETLHEQVEKFVIRYATGDEEPLAAIQVNPVKRPNTDADIKIDRHLVELGVPISRNDALQRYGRTLADGESAEDAPLKVANPAPQGGFGGPGTGLPNETPLQTAAGAFKNAPSKPDGQGDPSALPPSQIAKKRPSATEAVLAELASTILDGSVPYEEALKRAQEQLEVLDPVILAGGLEKALEEAMFKAAAEAMEESHPSQTSQLANEDEPETLWLFNEDRKKNGQFDVKGSGDKTQGMIESAMERRQRTSREALEKYNASTDHPTAEEVLSGDIAVTDALAKGFEVKFGGQKIIFFTDVLSGHYDNPSRLETDAKRLLLVKRAIAERNKLMPGRHYDSQIVLMPQKHLAPTEKKLVVIADAETGVARSIMMAQQNYCDRHFKLWKK